MSSQPQHSEMAGGWETEALKLQGMDLGTVLSVAIHTPDRAVDPLKGTVGELEFRDCGEVPWRGLLLTAERRILGM